MSEAIRFRFDVADLLPPPVDLRVLDGGIPLPDSAVAVPVHARPAWLPPLLPLFAEGRALRVEVARPPAPTFGTVLLEALAGLFAAAAAGSGVSVVGWAHGFLVGSHGLDRMPEAAQVSLVPADLVPASLQQAAEFLGLLPAARTLLVLNGSLPALERALGVPAATVVRMPLFGERELLAGARRLPPSLVSRRYGAACLALAREICACYRAGLS